MLQDEKIQFDRFELAHNLHERLGLRAMLELWELFLEIEENRGVHDYPQTRKKSEN